MKESDLVKTLEELKKTFGKPRPPINPSSLISLCEQKEYGKVVLGVSRSLNLNMPLKIGYVDSGGPKRAVAWVLLPHPMPMYGTENFKNFLITVLIRKTFLKEAPSLSVLFALSHELSHIILEGLRHPLAHMEEAVDLTAMYLGYRNIYKTASEFHPSLSSGPLTIQSILKVSLEDLFMFITGSTRVQLGYLKREEYEFAANWMARQ